MSRHIQIRSFVLGGNHGQYLQAAGLQREIKALCPDARVTHARYNAHLGREMAAQLRVGLLPKFLRLWQEWRGLDYSELTAPADLRVYGSDQIWSFSNPAFDPDPVLFGVGDDGPHIAYAPSMGAVPEGFVPPDWFGPAMERFAWIGARDAGTRDVVAGASAARPDLVADPAFFLDPTLGQGRKAGPRQGLTVYCPRAVTSVPAFLRAPGVRAAPDFASPRLFGYAPRRQFFAHLPQQLAGMSSVLEAVAQSRLLLTSTFHGIIMALLTRTPYLAIASPNLEARYRNPVGEAAGLSARLVAPGELETIGAADLERHCSTDGIDYDALQAHVAASRARLAESLAQARA